MRDFFFAISIIFLITNEAIAISSPENSQNIDLQKLEQKYSALGSLESDFIQEVYQASLARTKTSSGIIILSKPKNIRWETHKPERSVLVSNGNKLWYFSPDANNGKGQVVTRKASSLSANTLIGILNGSTPLHKEFNVLRSSKESDSKESERLANYKVLLKPKRKQADLKEVEVLIGSDYIIKHLILLYESGNKTKISLQNTKVGSKLPTNLFKFTPPKESELIEE